MTFGPKRTNPYRRSQGNNAWRVVRTTTYKFVAFENNTIIYRNGVSLATISAGGNSSLSLKAGDIITSNKYVSMTESGNGNTAMYSAWHGTRFAHRLERYNATLYFWNLFSPRETLTINISRGGTNITSVSLDGEWGSYNVGTTTGNYIFESDNGVRFSCIIGQFPTSDVMPLYPCDYKDEGPYELYGTASGSGDVIALEDNTSITEYTSAGGERTFTVNRGGNTALTSGGGQFAGSSVRLVADKPIYAFSIADGDGGEATPFVSPEAFGTHAAIPGSQNDFIKLVSNQPAVVNVNGTDRTLAGSNGIYQYYQTGSIPQGAILTSDTPFCAVYESDGNDETILSMWSQKNVKHVDFGPRIVTEGLVLALDAANPKSYPGSGTTWSDLTKNNNDITSSAVSYVSAENSMDLQQGTFSTTLSSEIDKYNFSYFCWFRPYADPLSNYRMLVRFRDTNNSVYFQIDTRQTTNPYILQYVKDYYISSWDTRTLYDNTEYNLYNWHYCGLVMESSTTWKTYLDGELLYTNTITKDLSPYTNIEVIEQTAPSVYMSNQLLYNRALSAAEIKQNFNATRGRFGI